jgi:hypothetical protein
MLPVQAPWCNVPHRTAILPTPTHRGSIPGDPWRRSVVELPVLPRITLSGGHGRERMFDGASPEEKGRAMTRSAWRPARYLSILLALTACGPSLPTPGASETTRQALATTATRLASPPLRTAAPACPSRGTAAPAAPVEQSVFAAQLRGKGFTVERVAEASQRFLCTYGAQLRLSGRGLTPPAELQAYIYDDPALAAANAKRVQPDTSVRWMESDGSEMLAHFAWVAPPHFFQAGRVLVLYTGTDQTVLATLAELLGPQFAGR